MSLEKKIQVASPPFRFIAFIIDFFVLMLFTRFVVVPFFLPQSWDMLSESEIVKAISPAYLVTLVLFFFKDFFFATSIGKSLLNLKIVQLNEEFTAPSFLSRIKRNIMLLILPIEIIKMLQDDYCRRYGDVWAKVIVIKKQVEIRIRVVTQKVLFIILIFTTLWSCYILLTPVQIEKSLFYKVTVDNLEINSNLQSKMGDLIKIKKIENYEMKEDIHYLQLAVVGSKQSGSIQAELIQENNNYLIQSIQFQIVK